MEFPLCQRCATHDPHAELALLPRLVPLSDYAADGSSVEYKAWACTNVECGFVLRIDKGDVSFGARGQSQTQRRMGG